MMGLILGWKGLDEFLGVHHETLRLWSNRYLKAPFRRIGGYRSRLVMEEGLAVEWFNLLCQRHPSLYRIAKLRKIGLTRSVK
jgi:hypothetical protein